MLEFRIPFEPVSWVAAKVIKKGWAYDPRDADKRAIRCWIKLGYKESPILVPTVIKMIFHFKPPESASKKRKIEMLAGKEIPTKKDCTNMQKLYEDCLKKIVVNDDRNVAKISSEKLYAEKDEVIIKVWTLKEYNEDCNRAS
jgi:Holliday junction resolvase RusA-like endonuclease